MQPALDQYKDLVREATEQSFSFCTQAACRRHIRRLMTLSDAMTPEEKIQGFVYQGFIHQERRRLESLGLLPPWKHVDDRSIN